ncbi:MAG: hypothetical protein U9R54_09350 [Bacteroidota bacterium]|nr:hypothetical protein [Bacteroidota bacterium]
MKKNVLIFVLMIAFNFAYSQNYVPSVEEVNSFFNTKTYVVLETNPIASYNFKIQEAVKNHWDITDYEFISYKKFEEMRGNSECSFLIMTQVVFEKDKTKVRYNFMHLLLGKDVKKFEDMPDIAAIPLSYTEVDEEFWAYKLGTIVRFLQNHVESLKNNPDLIDDNVFKHYNDNVKNVKQKTIYLIKDELEEDINTEAKIKKIYPYNVKIVDRETIEDAINNNEDFVFLHKVGPQGTRLRARCYKILIGAKDADFYYFDFHNIKKGKRPDAFLEKDLKKIAK